MKIRTLKKEELTAKIGAVNPKNPKEGFNKENACVKVFTYKKPYVDEAILEEVFGFGGFRIEPIFDGNIRGSMITVYGDNDFRNRTAYGIVDENTPKAAEKNPTAIAGFSLGIGTELYSAPEIIFWGRECSKIEQKEDGLHCYDSFEITDLKTTDDERKVILSITIKNTTSGIEKTFPEGRRSGAKVTGPTQNTMSPKPKSSELLPFDEVTEDQMAEMTPKAEAKATIKQLNLLKKLAAEAGKTEASVTEYYKAQSLEDLTKKQASEAIELFSNAKKKQ